MSGNNSHNIGDWMNSFVTLALLMVLVSCGARREGKTGAAGAPGSNGSNGLSLVTQVSSVEVDDLSCKLTNIYFDTNRDSIYSLGDIFQNGFLVCDGAVGAQGEQGEQGEAGSDGADGLNGSDGLDGVDGQDANSTYSIVEVVDPCPTLNGAHDEVLLKLGNGTYLASFSDNISGYNTRFSIISNGSYATTDGTGCSFTIPLTL
jgi:hypothetical protein